jgi:hypothetical protein
MNANFGLVEPLAGGRPDGRTGGRMSKERKKELLVQRAQADFGRFLEELR